jgi:RNA polymerase sigma-70 factor, ECF subfamily
MILEPTVQTAGPSRTPASEAQRRHFERDVLPLAHQMLNAARGLTHHAQDAEDLAQEVMLRAYSGFGSFRDGTSVKAWLYRILYNTWISQHRRRKCRPDELSVGCIAETQMAALAMRTSTASRSAEDVALEAMPDSELMMAFADLRADVRTTVYYADALELSSREIAAITDCPVGTVMSRLHRGRKRLRASLIEAEIRTGHPPGQQCLEPSPAA